MASLIHLELPRSAFSPRVPSSQIDNLCAGYRMTADWARRNMYGAAVTFINDSHPDLEYGEGLPMVYPKYTTSHLDPIADHYVSLEVINRCGQKIDLSTAWPITAIYVPVIRPHEGLVDDDILQRFHMYFPEQYGSTTWYRNKDTGLFSTVGEYTLAKSLPTLLNDEQIGFKNDWLSLNGRHAENTMTDRLLKLERITSHPVGVSDELPPFLHTQSHFIDSYMAHELWQRIVLVHPFIPKLGTRKYVCVSLFGDHPTDILVERFHNLGSASSIPPSGCVYWIAPGSTRSAVFQVSEDGNPEFIRQDDLYNYSIKAGRDICYMLTEARLSSFSFLPHNLCARTPAIIATQQVHIK
jgi:hypothetical protein